MNSARSPRRCAVILGVVVVGLFGLSPAAGAQDAVAPVSSALTQDGWWNRAKGPQPSEPANPIRSNIGGSIPAPSTVPNDGLGVGAAAGEPDKIAAVGIILEAPADALVDKLTLTLKETPLNGSQINAASAKIVACPITGFWAGVKNGDFVNRPMCDVGQSIPGSRAADGTWTFDLTVLASQWIDPTSGLTQNGVILMEAVDAPVSFQTSLADIASGTIKLDFAATAFPPVEEFTGEESFTSTETFDSGATTFEDVPVEDVPAETFDDSASFSSGAVSSTPTRTPRTAVTTPVAVPTGAPQIATPASNVGFATPATLFGNLPPFAVVFFLLVLAGAALFLGLVLGPLAAPSVATVRAGGVSRALAERDAARAHR